MTKIIKNLSLLVFWLTLISLSACGGGGSGSNTPVNPPQRGDVVSVTISASYGLSTLKTFSTNAGLFTYYQNLMFYTVNVYKVVYWTADHSGNLLQASGLLAIPQNGLGSTAALLSYDNGTTYSNNDAPTNNATLSLVAALVASTNFIVTVPDYIGYGASVAELHPYLHAESSANATIDLLRAAKHYLADNYIGLNGQLFLAGYSEGGYASVATHKAMQQQYASEFTVTADVAGDGPYDLLGTADTLLSSITLPYAPNVAFVFKAYDDIYGWNRISDIFQAAYVNPVNNDFYGDYTGDQIDAALTNVTADLFTPTFLSDYFSSTGETEAKARLAENSVYDWAPQAPVVFYHGIDDITVPYANAITAQTTMSTNGATDVAIMDCVPPVGVPADHANCAIPYLNYMLGYFLNLQIP